MVVLNAGESKMKMGTSGYTVAPTCSHTVRKIKEPCNKRNVQKSRRGINHQKDPTLDLTDTANMNLLSTGTVLLSLGKMPLMH